MKCVIDLNVIIDLHYGDILEKLFESTFEVETTDLVLSKLTNPEADEVVKRGLQVTTLEEKVMLETIRLVDANRPRISVDDASTLALALHKDVILLTGEKNLRNIAASMAKEVHGTLWVIEKMVEQSVLEPATAIVALEKMLASSRRLPSDEVEKLIKRLKRLG